MWVLQSWFCWQFMWFKALSCWRNCSLCSLWHVDINYVIRHWMKFVLRSVVYKRNLKTCIRKRALKCFISDIISLFKYNFFFLQCLNHILLGQVLVSPWSRTHSVHMNCRWHALSVPTVEFNLNNCAPVPFPWAIKKELPPTVWILSVSSDSAVWSFTCRQRFHLF